MSLEPLWTFQTYIETLVAQDKFIKLTQYFAKFLAYTKLESDKEASTKLAKLSSILADGRRMNRFGSEIKFIQAITKFTPDRLGNITDVLSLLNAVCMTVYIIFDHYFYLASAGILTGDKRAYKLRSATAWFWGVLFSIVLNSLKLYNTIEKEKKEVREKKDATSTRAAKRSLIIQYFKLVPDFVIAINAAEISNRFSNDGLLGILGCVSALQGILTTWPSKK